MPFTPRAQVPSVVQTTVNSEVSLASSPGVGATSFALDAIPDGLVIGSNVAIDAFTTQCELRKVTGVSGSTITVAALKFAHATGDSLVVLVERVSANVFGLTGDGTDEWAPVQRFLREGAIMGLTMTGAIGTGAGGSIQEYMVAQPLMVPTSSHIDRLQIKSHSSFAPVESTTAVMMPGQQNWFFTAAASTNVFTSDSAHGMVAGVDDPVMFNAPYGETLPGGVVAGHRYYVLTVPTASSFTVSSTPGGGTLDVTSDGAGWGMAGPGARASRVFWESLRVELTVANLNGIILSLQQPSWTRNMRVEMDAAATSQGSAIGIQIGGQLSYHDNIECNTSANCTGLAVWFTGGACSGHSVRGFNCNGVNDNDTGMVIAGGRLAVSDIWTEQCGRAGIELDPAAGGSIGLKGLTISGYWLQQAATTEAPALLVSSTNCSYALNCVLTSLGTDAILVQDTARSITIRAWDGNNPDGGETDHNLSYMGHQQFSTLLMGPVLNNRHQKGVSTDYTVQRIINCVNVDATGAQRTITIPTAANWFGWDTTVLNGAGANNVVLDPVAAETIDGASTLTLVPGEAAHIISDGFNYRIVDRKLPGSAQTYTATNVTTDRSYDADTVLVAELADVVGTLIADLRSWKIVA